MAETVFDWLRVWTIGSVATALLYGQCLAASRRHYARRVVGTDTHPVFCTVGAE